MALRDGMGRKKMACGCCKYWRQYETDKHWGECMAIRYPTTEIAIDYVFLDIEDLNFPASEPGLMLECASNFGCVLYKVREA